LPPPKEPLGRPTDLPPENPLGDEKEREDEKPRAEFPPPKLRALEEGREELRKAELVMEGRFAAEVAE